MTKLKEWMGAATLACLWACGSPEQATVDQFFRAAQTDDNQTLASMSAVGPPVQTVSWQMVEISSRTTEPFTLPKLLDQFEAAEKDREAKLKEGREYLAEQADALDRIIPKVQEDSEYKFSGALGEVQEDWMRLLEERKEKERAFQELKRAVETETRIAAKSMMSGANVKELAGDVSVTKMLLNLKPRDGDELPFSITLRKYDLSRSGSDRTEPARWIIVDIEGTTAEARAAADAPTEERAPAAASVTATAALPETSAGESEQPARSTAAAPPREFRGLGRVQILAPATRIEGNEVVSMLRVRNVSKGWLTRFTVTEYWYDEQGTATMGGSLTHQEPFMPDVVIEIELRTGTNSKFYQNQFEFKHANGEVSATVVASLPEPSE
jgi:hypothetical protein